MPIKLMVWVLPGVELTCASFCWSRELMRLDLPTLDRPRKANSGGPSGGKWWGSAAEMRNLAWGFICCSYIPSEAREPYCLQRSSVQLRIRDVAMQRLYGLILFLKSYMRIFKHLRCRQFQSIKSSGLCRQ